jgi:phosphoribosylaminoimidazole carboxylase PurE protein
VVREFTENAEANGLEVIIAAAGSAAHLAGVVAAHTILPVIGIPVQGGALNGLDALLSTVQMPGGIAVATVGIGSGGPTNAGLLAVQILARQDGALRERLLAYRAKRREQVMAADAQVSQQ